MREGKWDREVRREQIMDVHQWLKLGNGKGANQEERTGWKKGGGAKKREVVGMGAWRSARIDGREREREREREGGKARPRHVHKERGGSTRSKPGLLSPTH